MAFQEVFIDGKKNVAVDDGLFEVFVVFVDGGVSEGAVVSLETPAVVANPTGTSPDGPRLAMKFAKAG